MINQLNNTTTQYEQALQTSLATATIPTDLVTALTTFDDSNQSDRLKWILTNYQKGHISSFAEATLIQDALATL